MTQPRKKRVPEEEKEEQKELIGAAIDDWMDKKWAAFGKWSGKGIAAAAFGYMVYFLFTKGWIHK